MPVLDHLVHMSLARALGWTVFHSLWEGALAAFILVAVLSLTRSPRLRYACACLAMLATLSSFGITLSALCYEEAGRRGAAVNSLPAAPILEDQSTPVMTRSLQMGDALAWLAPFWIAGVFLFHVRSIASWATAQRLKRRGVCRAPNPWPQRLESLRHRLCISRPVTLFETCLSDIPVVVGHLRPVILVPIGMLSGMSHAQMEAILLHELAHIVRCDYLVNLLQTLVEGFLFYHPAVWWISGIVRTERENCCDDLVVSAGGDAREYAAALTTLEQTRCAAHESALAASGGNLVTRIRRLLYPPRRTALPAVLLRRHPGARCGWRAADMAGKYSGAEPGFAGGASKRIAIYAVAERRRPLHHRETGARRIPESQNGRGARPFHRAVLATPRSDPRHPQQRVQRRTLPAHRIRQ